MLTKRYMLLLPRVAMVEGELLVIDRRATGGAVRQYLIVEAEPSLEGVTYTLLPDPEEPA